MDILSKDTLVIATASQNRPGFDSSIERAMPLFAARTINRIKDTKQHTELWNNIGSKMDDAYRENHKIDENRRSYSERLLKERYDFMENLGLTDSRPVEIITDDSESFTAWTKDCLGKYVKSGKIYPSEKLMSICNSCGMTIGVHIESQNRLLCQVCKTNDYYPEMSTGWFMDVDKTKPNILLPRKSQHLASHAHNIAEQVWIERHRTYGIPLDNIGSSHYLDPKLGLALMPSYLAETSKTNRFIFVQGKDTIYNTAPYVQTFSPELETAYILTANVPRNIDAQWAKDYGSGFTSRYLPLFAMDRTTDVTSTQITDLKREFDNALGYMDKYCTDAAPNASDETLEGLRSELSQVTNLFEALRVRDSIIRFRRIAITTAASNGLLANEPTSSPIAQQLRERIDQIYGTK